MSYTTPPPANRIGIIQGWSNQLLSKHANLAHTSFNVYLKSYILLQEYLRFYEVNLLFFEIKTLANNNKLINVLIYNNYRHSSILYDNENQITSLRKKNQAKFKTYFGFSKNFLNLTNKKFNKHLYGQNRLKYFFENFFYDHFKNFYLYHRKAYFRKANNLKTKQQRFFMYFDKKTNLNFKIKNKITRFRKTFYSPKKINKYTPKKFKKKNFTFKKVFWKRMKYRRFRKIYTYLKEWKRALYVVLKKSRKYRTTRYKKRFHSKKYGKKNFFLKKRLFVKKKLSSRLKSKPKVIKKKHFSRKKSKIRIIKKIHSIFRPEKKKLLWKLRKFWRKTNWIKFSLYKTRYIKRTSRKQRLKKKRKIKIAWRKVLKANKKKLKMKKILKMKPRKKYKIRRKKFRLKKQKLHKKKLALLVAKLKKKNIIRAKKISRFSLKKQKVRFYFKKLRQALKRSIVLWAYTSKSIVKKKLYWALILLTIRRNFNLKKKTLKIRSSQPIFFRYILWKQKIKAFYPNKYNFLKLFSAEYIFTKHFNKVNKRLQLYNILWRLLWYRKQIRKIKKKELQRTKLKQYKFNYENSNRKIVYDAKQSQMFYNDNSKKLQLQLKLFIEKRFESVSNVPVFAKIKNIADYSNLFTKQKQRKFKKKLFLKRFYKNDFFWKLLSLVINTQKYMFPQMLADFLATELTFDRKHRRLLRNFKLIFSAFRSDHIMGYKILVDGKLNGVMKTTKQVLKLQNKEKVPVQTFDKKVSYALGVSRTFAGLFGVHVWLYY